MFGTWLKRRRKELNLSLREMARRCEQSSLGLGEGKISPSYLNHLEKGADVSISPGKLIGIKDVLVVSYERLLQNLTEKNRLVLERELVSLKNVQLLDAGLPDKVPEWHSFLRRIGGIYREVLDPLLWELVDREIMECHCIPYTWPDDFWAGVSTIEDMGECVADLADIYDALSDSQDRVAIAARAAIEGALGSDYIEERRKRRSEFEEMLKKKLEEKKLSS